MKKLITTALAVAILFSTNVSNILADGNPYGPYNPYEPHKPIPTGLEDTTIFYIIGLIIFAVGMSSLAVAKILKEKQSLK